MARRFKVPLSLVAREAGVSIATVDRVVNLRPGVRKHTCELVWETINRLEKSPTAPILNGGTPSRDLHFDFILPPGPNTFMRMLDDAIVTAGEGLARVGVTIELHHIEGFNAPVLADAIASVRDKSDGIVIKALENPVVREAVNETSELGVPVVTLVSELNNSRRIGYVGIDNRAAGRTAGYLMGRFIGPRKGAVALLAGSVALSYRDHQERELGFRDALAEQFVNLTIVDRSENHDDFQKAYDLTQSLVERFPDLVGIYIIGGGARGVGQALKDAGRGESVVFIGHELTKFTRQYLIDGTMDAVLNQDVRHEAVASLQMLLDHYDISFVGPSIGKPRIEVFVRENLP